MRTMLDDTVEINLYRFEKNFGSNFVGRKVQKVFAPIEFVL